MGGKVLGIEDLVDLYEFASVAPDYNLINYQSPLVDID